jgi:hypothetical protein
MRIQRPIPPEYEDEFAGVMAGYDDVGSDERWLSMLEDAARRFMEDKGISGDAYDAVHQYLEREA